ncbi:MAG: transporter permease [Naasia sp.]|jgi:ribose/xylose/arabinose/galactoside ABC-type transport system permease subunit|uniref:ABC transporter permease n=1 Tax=Naasia sp. TaxID=2546198 RepID=UPI0026165718|nr:ABC transporter permease [Naasia sp.]MCU1570165.1 transporter permease [Naasia sp.]
MTLSTAVDRSAAHRPPLAVQVVDWLSRYSAISTTVLLLIVAAIVTPTFYDETNLRTVAVQTSALGIVVLGQMVVLLVRGIDMSVSAVVAVTGVIATSAAGGGANIAISLAAAVGLALMVGLVNGLLITWRKVPPFIATFIMFIVVSGALLAYTKAQTSGSAPAWLRRVGSGSIAGVPLPTIIWIAMGLLLFGVLTRTIWGRYVYSVGANPEASRHAGVPVFAVTMSAYVLCALCALVGGLMYSGYSGYIDQNLGNNVNLNSIAAAIIGGVAFSGGRGGVLGAAVGALLLTVLTNMVVVAGLEIYWQLIAQGLVLIFAVAINGLRDRWIRDTA